jgi:hypothetical protein
MKKIQVLSLLFLIVLFSCVKEEVAEDENTTFDLKASKMEQMGSLFDAIARQPENAKLIIKSGEISYFDYKELLPISDVAIVQRGKARGTAFGLLFIAISRQPEAYHLLDSAAEKFFGKYDTTYISKELLDVTRTYAVAGLNESLARQPMADSILNVCSKKYMNFSFITASK